MATRIINKLEAPISQSGNFKRHWGDVSLPSKFTINLTHRCNLACDMCTQYGAKFKKDDAPELTPEQWGAFFESIAWIFPKVTLFGGEPTIYPGFKDVVEKLAELSIPFKVVTNGYFLRDYLSRLVDLKADIFLSIDGLAETHNRIRNSQDSFERILYALSQLKFLRQKKRSYLGINFVLLPENINEVESFLKFALEHDPDLVTLQHPQYSNKKINRLTDAVWKKHLGCNYTTKLFTKKKYSFSTEYIYKLIHIIETVKKSSDYQGRVTFFPNLDIDEVQLYYSDDNHFLLLKEHGCIKPWTSPTIDPDGSLSLCQDYFVGNIAQQDFWTIWDSQIANRFRRYLAILGKFPSCTRCCEFYGTQDLPILEEKR